MATADLYLPEECWVCVIKFLIDNDDHNRHLKPLSLVSKQFLSLTNRLRVSLAIYNSPHTSLSSLFHRFSNIT
ncbi:F-box/LRR-repeat protein, partial [Trifolium medium]|nr:F-box/LRR-repeat protein [Trifolium medium]